MTLLNPQFGHSQVGQSLTDVRNMPGVTRHSPWYPSHPLDPVVYQVKATPAYPVTKTFHICEDRVGGLLLEWPGELTLEEALSQLNAVTGLPELTLPPRKPAWQIDAHQLKVCPPLGASEIRDATVPAGIVQTGTVARWTDYYTKWGDYLGRSPVRFEPVLTVYTRYVGPYRFQATKFVIPLVRCDSAAYAMLELSNESNRGGFATKWAYIAESETYSRSRFADLRSEAREIDQDSTKTARARRSLKDLRPYHLEVEDLYREALLENIPTEAGAFVLATWKSNALVGAVDDEHVSRSTVQAFLSECDPESLRAALLDGFKQSPLEICIRRAEAIDSLGSLEWVPPMADLLRQKAKHDAVLEAMQTLAAKHADNAEEIAALGDDKGKWKNWYKVQRKRGNFNLR